MVLKSCLFSFFLNSFTSGGLRGQCGSGSPHPALTRHHGKSVGGGFHALGALAENG